MNLGDLVNSPKDDFHPAISPDGLSLYISSNRDGSGIMVDPACHNGPGALVDDCSANIWVSRRTSLDAPWGTPNPLGPNINTGFSEFAPEFSPDGHRMFFSS